MTSQLSFGSLFSGIGGFDLGLERAGMKCVWQVENDRFCNEILSRHWPDVPKYGDITTVEFSGLERVDMVCGGFPCQDVSVAGNRAGLAGERSQLFWEAIRCIRVLEPRWVLIENVPGLFSSNNGGDFAAVIGALDELGYGVAWRVFDSQNFGVAQRRRRVFIVGCLGKPCPPEVLFEPESLSGDSQARRETGQAVADTINASASRRDGIQGGQAYPIRTRSGRGSPERHDETFVAEPLRSEGGSWSAQEWNTVAFGPSNYADGKEWHELDTARALNGDSRDGATSALVAGTVTQRSGAHTGNSRPIPANLISSPTDPDRVRETTGLSGRLDSEGRREPDSPRYRALGNAVTVNVAEWIGRRIHAL